MQFRCSSRFGKKINAKCLFELGLSCAKTIFEIRDVARSAKNRFLLIETSLERQKIVFVRSRHPWLQPGPSQATAGPSQAQWGLAQPWRSLGAALEPRPRPPWNHDQDHHGTTTKTSMEPRPKPPWNHDQDLPLSPPPPPKGDNKK